MIRRAFKVFAYYLADVKNKLFNPAYKLQKLNIGGVGLKVYQGTFTKEDKDDAWLAFLVKEAKVIFDVGANMGWTAILANVFGSPERVFLIDPNPIALTYASGNMIINDFAPRCTFIKSFVSSNPGEKVKFYTIDTGAAGSMFVSHAKTASALNNWFWVSTTTIDQLVAEHNVTPDLIKIDVEGAEQLVLLGAQRLARANNVKFFIEMHANSEMSMEQNANSILAWCGENGYRAWYLTDAVELLSAEQIKHRGRCHLLLLKFNVDYPERLREIKQSDKLPSSSK